MHRYTILYKRSSGMTYLPKGWYVGGFLLKNCEANDCPFGKYFGK